MTPPTAIRLEPQWHELADIPVVEFEPARELPQPDEHSTLPHPEPSERLIFVTDDGRRALRAALAGRAVAALCATWIGATIVGSLGSGGLPTLPEAAGGSNPITAQGAQRLTSATTGLPGRPSRRNPHELPRHSLTRRQARLTAASQI